jgi:protein-L-isoaspartate(D-aspartate) O-methyltransferase
MVLIDDLIREGWLKTPRIIDAFNKIKREDFLPEEIKDLAVFNKALSIGYDQTISQPLVVAFMLELLEPKEGDKILDIGSGSGWTTALLAEIVRKKGKIFSLEIIPELKEFGERNVFKYNFIQEGIVEFICADALRGYSKYAPYDKILASASAKKIPDIWKEQLKEEGRIVAPENNSIFLIIKKLENLFEEKEYPGFAFVPLIIK